MKIKEILLKNCYGDKINIIAKIKYNNKILLYWSGNHSAYDYTRFDTIENGNLREQTKEEYNFFNHKLGWLL